MKLTKEEVKYLLSPEFVSVRGELEIAFYLEGDAQYSECWMGKMPNSEKPDQEIFWYGLVEDGTQSYNYSTAEELLQAKVFYGKDLLGILEQINWYSLDASNFEEMWNYYQGNID
ncbi:hypothetical protein lbkm_2468 [Lachnospiraceae bacterium KM106-2]|nr:hypothetical protein lbkm_2468 [Lachnospiraceae bacterium KM106-2]